MYPNDIIVLLGLLIIQLIIDEDFLIQLIIDEDKYANIFK